MLVVFAPHHLIWVAIVSVALLLLAGAARLALTPAAADQGMPFREVPQSRHAFLIMNPRSGGGKVAKFGLKEKTDAPGFPGAVIGGAGVHMTNAGDRGAVCGWRVVSLL